MTDSDNSNGDFSRPIPQAAAAFAYAGALPFVVTAFLCWYPIETFEPGSLARTSVETMLGFSVVILSFMGGVRWGIAAGAAGGPRFSHLLVSIVPRRSPGWPWCWPPTGCIPIPTGSTSSRPICSTTGATPPS
ncbi:MAG: DUF3429 family protein [bacterium]